MRKKSVSKEYPTYILISYQAKKSGPCYGLGHIVPKNRKDLDDIWTGIPSLEGAGATYMAKAVTDKGKGTVVAALVIHVETVETLLGAKVPMLIRKAKKPTGVTAHNKGK